MLISHSHKLITIDIPKTGTRSFRESLYPLGLIDVIGEPFIEAKFYQHGTAISAKKQFAINNWNWNDYFKFTIVRNPWARYFSFFKYFKNYADKFLCKDKSIDWSSAEINQGQQCVSLFHNSDERTVLKNIILNNSSQDSYYCNENGEIIVNYIADFENLENEFIFLCNQVDINTPTLKHDNKSANTLNMHDIYDQYLVDLVAEKEKKLIELKNYDYIS
jgi:hypothetical protein